MKKETIEKYSNLIRTDCYFAVLHKFEEKNRDAHFEVVTRQWQNSYLSPSWDLLYELKDGKISFEEYFVKLRMQIENDPNAMERLGRLKEMVLNSKTVFVVCVEKDATKCHRTLVKRMLLEMLDRS